MSEEKQKLIPLTNSGVSDFFSIRRGVRMKLNQGQLGIVKLEIEDLGEKVLCLKEEVTGEDLTVYMGRLEKPMSNTTIKNDDKVFFLKNSKFPRTVFNRYSKGAKRVQDVDKATKIVFNVNEIHWWTSHNNVDSKLIGDDIYLNNINMYSMGQELDRIDLSTANNPDDELKLLKKWKKLFDGSYYNNHHDDCKKIFDELCKLMFVEEFKPSNGRLVFNNKIDQETLVFIAENKPWISKLVNDKQVNKYINQFKSPLTLENYDVMKQALCSGRNNITMGLKLLENMDIKSNPVLFYALVTHMDANNATDIRNNQLWNSIGMKNLRTNYDLEELISRYSPSSYGVLQSLEQIMKERLLKKEDKKQFLSLTSELILKNVSGIIGDKVMGFLNIDVGLDESN